MDYRRMPIEVESPEQLGYQSIACNLAESSVSDAVMSRFNADLSSLVLCYGDHYGHPDLRNEIAREAGADADDVLLVPGAATGLFIIATSLLEKGKGISVVHPNYATNLETPFAIGARIDKIRLDFEQSFIPALEDIRTSIKEDTQYVSITNPHNPSGAMISEEQLKEIVKLVCETKGKPLLVDETYRYMCFGMPPVIAASLHENVISVSSVSKAFGLPGIRMGWIICRNKKMMEKFLAAKEQILICNSVVDEELAYQAFKGRESWLNEVRSSVMKKYAILESCLNQHQQLEWVRPGGGVVVFPRIREPEKYDIPAFYKILFEKYKTLVGAGHWFDMPDHYMRIGFGWPSEEELSNGLANIDKALKESR